MFFTKCTRSTNSPAAERSVTGRPVVGKPGWVYTRYATVRELSKLDRPIERSDDFWVSPPTLAYLAENALGFSSEALVVTHGETGQDIYVCLQEFTFSAAGNVRESAQGQRSKVDFRRQVLAPFQFKVVTLGQLLTSGPYAVDVSGGMSETKMAELLSAVADTLLEDCGKYSAVLLKDLFPTGGAGATLLRRNGYYQLPVDPIMELPIPAGWKGISDYLAAITSKYRVRYRRARKKMDGVTRRELLPEEVTERQAEIFELYRAITQGADYNAATLQPSYFAWLAQQTATRHFAGSGFYGYFDNQQLVGFTSTVPNGATLHAHYLGMVGDYKTSHHLYHNMLFDLLDAAIEGGFGKLDYGRTAIEIKSSVGAIPVAYDCLLKARSAVLNRLVPIFTPAVYQSSSYDLRNPFRGETR